MRILRARYTSAEEFLRHYLPSLGAEKGVPSGGLFFPTRMILPPGEPVLLEVRFPGLSNKELLRGTVAWHRTGKHRAKLRAGLAIELHPAEKSRRDFLLGVARGEIADMAARRHRRLPVSLEARWRIVSSRKAHPARMEDIGQGGALVRSQESPLPGVDVVLEVMFPQSVQPYEISGRVAWVRHSEENEGFGVEFRNRDAGGIRLVRELIRRLEVFEAEEEWVEASGDPDETASKAS